MLLARGKGENVTGVAVDVVRLADDTAGELAGHGIGRRHDAEVRAAERGVKAEGLAVGHDDVRTAFARGLHDGGGDHVDAHDKLRARGMNDLADGGSVFHHAEVVGLLDEEAGCVFAEGCLESGCIGLAVLRGNDDKLGVGGEAVGLHGLDDLGIDSAGDIRLRALAILAHGDGLRRSGAAVIVGGVGHIHAGELADHGLELENALKHALRNFRLIRRVAGDKLLAGGDGLDNGGDEMAIRAGAAKNGLVDLVLLCHGGDHLAHFQLAEALGELQAVADEHIVRNALVKVIERLDADGRKHLLALLGGMGDIRAHIRNTFPFF